jgi:asparagine synthase (glutamine-hydrolysing)
MCGISGIVDPQRAAPAMQASLRLMGRYLHHRGPDGWGEWFGEGVALGHNRLAILDLAGGVQPMECHRAEHVIVFNGEIYNFRALRREIVAAGGVLRTDHSDTEAIVEGYRLWGQDIFRRLDGMFACAIWTPATRRLVLARDRVGIKPAYFCRTQGGGLAFASEPKALVGAGLVTPRLNLSALAQYFVFRAPLHPDSLFEGVQSVAPGTLVTFIVETGELLTRPFVDVLPDTSYPARNADEASVQAALEAAVASHLVADVEVGVFLSGGVDSSLVAALASRQQRIRAFNLSTNGPLDEFEFATKVARHLGLDLHSRRVTPEHMLESFDLWAYFNDDPVADPSALALLLLAEDVRAHGLKVMLSGEGADELFGGYRAYQRYVGARMVTDVVGSIPSMFNRAGDAQLREYLAEADGPYWGTAHVTTAEMRRQLLGGVSDDAVARAKSAGHGSARDHLRHAMLVDQRLRLPSDVLMRTDRATMAWSIEARVPMLANEVIAESWRLPGRALCGWLPPTGKPLLKRVAARHVPADVIYRRKVGFDLPMRQWLARDFRPTIDRMLIEGRIDGLDYPTIGRWQEAVNGGQDRMAGALWAWLVLETWYRRWVESVTPPRVGVEALTRQ